MTPTGKSLSTACYIPSNADLNDTDDERMNEQHAAELYRQEGANSRFVNLTVKPDGSVLMEAQDMGEKVEQIWGDSDYEYWVHVAPPSLPKLAFELLREKFAGRLDAVEAFRDWCQAHGVEHEFGNYA